MTVENGYNGGRRIHTMLRIGILGCGNIAGTLAGTMVRMPETLRIEACASRDKAKAEEFASRFDIPKAYGSYEELYEDSDIDLIYIATPHSHHKQQMIAALEHGRNVLSEKAFTVNEKEAKEVFDLAKEKGLFAGEAIWTRYMPSRRIIDGIISSGGGAVAVSSSQDCIERLRKYADLGSPYVDLPDMNAALGIVQLSKIDTLLERRRSIFQMYLQAQRKSDTRLFGSASPLFSSNGYGFSVIVKARPDDAIAFANKYSVSCKRTFSGSVGQRYQDKYDRFPNAIAFITRAISFPLYPFLSKNDLETIQRVISHIS